MASPKGVQANFLRCEKVKRIFGHSGARNILEDFGPKICHKSKITLQNGEKQCRLLVLRKLISRKIIIQCCKLTHSVEKREFLTYQSIFRQINSLVTHHLSSKIVTFTKFLPSYESEFL